MLTFCNSYVLWLLRCVQLRLVTVTFCDVIAVWCYVLSQYRGVWFSSNLLYIPLCFLSYSHIPHTARAFKLFSFSQLVFVFRNRYKKPSENCEPWYIIQPVSDRGVDLVSFRAAAPPYTHRHIPQWKTRRSGPRPRRCPPRVWPSRRDRPLCPP